MLHYKNILLDSIQLTHFFMKLVPVVNIAKGSFNSSLLPRFIAVYIKWQLILDYIQTARIHCKTKR